MRRHRYCAARKMWKTSLFTSRFSNMASLPNNDVKQRCHSWKLRHQGKKMKHTQRTLGVMWRSNHPGVLLRLFKATYIPVAFPNRSRTVCPELETICWLCCAVLSRARCCLNATEHSQLCASLLQQLSARCQEPLWHASRSCCSLYSYPYRLYQQVCRSPCAPPA